MMPSPSGHRAIGAKTPRAAMMVRTSSATKSIKFATCSGVPGNFFPQGCLMLLASNHNLIHMVYNYRCKWRTVRIWLLEFGWSTWFYIYQWLWILWQICNLIPTKKPQGSDGPSQPAIAHRASKVFLCVATPTGHRFMWHTLAMIPESLLGGWRLF